MQIGALQEIILSIAEARSLNPILELVVRRIAANDGVALSRLWLLQADADCPICQRSRTATDKALHLRGSSGASQESHAEYSDTSGRFHRIPLGERKIGQIAASGKAMLIPKVTGKEEWIANPAWIREEGIQSFAGQPLIFRGETLGVLAVFSRVEFSEEDFLWLRTFADHAAVAIANARAFEELERLRAKLEAENDYLHEEIRDTHQFGEIVGHSPALRKVLEQVSLVAETNATVLIQGESGTGKELIARAIHERSPRRSRPFVRVNCGAIPEALFESEFFGHVRGAFTGAIKDRVGRFELAESGTLFLDEIAELPLALQTKLLRVLQEKQYERVGDARTRSVDVRLVAATNRNLKKEIEAGRFREDLYYRLTVFPIELPPLRERKEDIKALAFEFLKRASTKLKLKVPPLTGKGLRQLESYDWPGNIRELENVIDRAAILSKTSGQLIFALGSATMPSRLKSSPDPRPTAEISILTTDELRKRETENILAALRQSNGKVFGPGGAAEILGMRPTTLASRLKTLGLKKSFFPERET
jgi:transcriptional regulator with GAF, ATPase, and Fis domain